MPDDVPYRDGCENSVSRNQCDSVFDLHPDHHVYFLRFDSCESRERGELVTETCAPETQSPRWASLDSQENRACELKFRLGGLHPGSGPVYRVAMLER